MNLMAFIMIIIIIIIIIIIYTYIYIGLTCALSFCLPCNALYQLIHFLDRR